MKIKPLFIVLLFSIAPLYAEETGSPPAQGPDRGWDSFPYSLGAGVEYGNNTRTDYALGYSVAIDRYIYNRYTAFGIRGTMYNDFTSITASEAELLLRLYFLDAGHGAFFGQLGFGAAFYREEDRQVNTYIMDFTAGYRFYVQEGLSKGFYVEPYVRTGYPFKWGFGLFIGHWFNF